jgi:AraC-like DNA-binding protein
MGRCKEGRGQPVNRAANGIRRTTSRGVGFARHRVGLTTMMRKFPGRYDTLFRDVLFTPLGAVHMSLAISAPIRRALALIAHTPNAVVPVAALAAAAGMSRWHFSRVFRTEVGVPPCQYLRRARVERAASALSLGATIAGAAYDAGFADQAYMTHCFRAVLGTTPGQYVRSSRICPHSPASPASNIHESSAA